MRQGHTLIELVITILIIAIMAAGAFISIESYKSLRLDAAAKRMASDLDYARNLALSTAKWYRVDFAVEPNNMYQVYNTTGLVENPVDNPIEDPSSGNNFVVNLNDSYNGVKIVALSLGVGLPDIPTDVYFNPLGVPYANYGDPILPVGDNGQIVLQYGDDEEMQKTVLITPNTGRISIE